MTWSLQLRNGDLTLSAAHYGTVTGKQKLVQDLRCYLLERMGSDDMHPNYGSLLDGGYTKGREVPGIIGEIDPDVAELAISTEIKRIALEYQSRQLERAKADRNTYGKTSLLRGEVLLAVEAIEFEHRADALIVKVTILSANKDTALLELDLTG